MNPASSSENPSSSAVQVLILEPDERLAMDVLAAVNEAMPGIRTRVARSINEALNLVIDQKPKLFVLDFDTTPEQAQDFVYDLRTSHPKARAIILTATHFTVEREQASGLGAIHYLEKPFPRADFITLVEAVLTPAGDEAARFHGTLSDLHVADIIQLKCIGGATSMLEFTGPRCEKARVYFKQGQVRHASTGDKEGLEAFNEIVDWKGGKISEVMVPPGIKDTISLDWQVLLMEAVRHLDESRGLDSSATLAPAPTGQKILLIDDSAMLLGFVKEILEEDGYEVATAETAKEGLESCRSNHPDLILLDFVLPDMQGDEVCRELLEDPTTALIPVVYVSGLGSELAHERQDLPNIIGLLSKPFTSEWLLQAVRQHLNPNGAIREGELVAPVREFVSPVVAPRPTVPAGSSAVAPALSSLGFTSGPKPVAPIPDRPMTSTAVDARPVSSKPGSAPTPAPAKAMDSSPNDSKPGETVDPYFCGDSGFFSLNWALHTIATEKLTGTLRAFWSRDTVELLSQDGKVVIVTTRDPSLYCEESPVTLLNVPRERVDAARARQAKDSCPLFVTLVEEGLILREPGLQLVQHYGQKLFSQLWTDRVRFMFVQHDLPDYAREISPSEDEIDQWTLSTLRFVQYEELQDKAMINATWIPAYTRDGFSRVQNLRLTVAEAQFASQFNGSRSIMQISKNLRLDITFARLTLFRFLALEIVECWPPELKSKRQARGRGGLFGR